MFNTKVSYRRHFQEYLPQPCPGPQRLMLRGLRLRLGSLWDHSSGLSLVLPVCQSVSRLISPSAVVALPVLLRRGHGGSRTDLIPRPPRLPWSEGVQPRNGLGVTNGGDPESGSGGLARHPVVPSGGVEHAGHGWIMLRDDCSAQ